MSAELDYYKEQLELGKHMEVQRSVVAGLTLTTSGAIIGYSLRSPASSEGLVSCFLIEEESGEQISQWPLQKIEESLSLSC
jgi:hypothetical protein